MAAGLGERLRPITLHIPKPLLPLLGKPAVEHVLDRLSPFPISRIGINLHYKKEAVEEWANSCSLKDMIRLFPEERILGTGGALKNAEELLRESSFLVHNSDIITDINLQELLEFHSRSENLVTLSVHDRPEFNCLVVGPEGRLRDIKTGATPPEGGGRALAFTGIAVYEPGFLDYLPDGRSSVVDAWLAAARDGQRIGVYQAEGHGWSDIGTPAAYASAVFEKLRDEGEVLYFHESSNMGGLDVQGYAVIERGCDIRGSVTLSNCILLPGCKIGDGSGAVHESLTRKGSDETLIIENSIIGPDYLIKLDTREVPALYGEEGRQLIGAGGSDRRYYRVREGDKTIVQMRCRSDDPDFERHIEYTRFFLKVGIPVPSLISSEPERMEAYFEDGGDISLYTCLKLPREDNEIESLYRKVIDLLALLHAKATEDVSSCPLLEKRIFDYEHFRWETEYFAENFVRGIGEMEIRDSTSLEKEFDALALKADSFPKTVMHRDFQSRNIMVVKGEKILIIDFQGARMGPPAYDLASVLWDPYYRLDDGMRGRLADYYITLSKKLNPAAFDEKTFRESVPVCRLQRHMQALGAFGFLSSVKGKKYFLRYLPEGLRLLKEDISLLRDEYPELYGLVMRLAESRLTTTHD